MTNNTSANKNKHGANSSKGAEAKNGDAGKKSEGMSVLDFRLRYVSQIYRQIVPHM